MIVLRRKERGRDVQGHGTLHLVFMGNAGTGKTTVVRLNGKIYKKLGLLKKNVWLEHQDCTCIEVYTHTICMIYDGRTVKFIERKQ